MVVGHNVSKCNKCDTKPNKTKQKKMKKRTNDLVRNPMTKTRTYIVLIVSYCFCKTLCLWIRSKYGMIKIKPDCVQRNRNLQQQKEQRKKKWMKEIKIIIVGQFIATFYNLFGSYAVNEFHGHEWYFFSVSHFICRVWK